MAQIEQKLQQWLSERVIDEQAADRIRAFESSHESQERRWPVVLAIVFGAIMIGAGILLFVAAHWEDLSPTQRFLLVLTMIAGFHLAAGALMPRLRALGIALQLLVPWLSALAYFLLGRFSISRNIGPGVSCSGPLVLCFHGLCYGTGFRQHWLRCWCQHGSQPSGVCG